MGQEHSRRVFYARVTSTTSLLTFLEFLPQLILNIKLALLSSILLVLAPHSIGWLACWLVGFRLNSPVGNFNLDMNTKLSVESNILI